MANAEINIELEVMFECPHCGANQATSNYGEFDYAITVGTYELNCIKCSRDFDLNINEA